MNLVTPIKIQGKKTKLIDTIRNEVGDVSNKIWVEPFLGSAEVLFNINPKYAYVSDNNEYIISFFNAIKNGTIDENVARRFLEFHGKKLKDGGKDYYYEMRKQFNQNHDPLYFLFLNRSCFNGVIRFNSKGEFNVPFCNKPDRFAKALITKICNQIRSIREIVLSHGDNWVFAIADWKTTVVKFEKKDNCIFYFDPPYVNRHATYFDDWSEEKNSDFFEYLSNIKSNFVLSNWYGNDYRSNEILLKYFDEKKYRYIFQNHFYFVGGNLGNRKGIVECLVTNVENKNE